MAQEGVDYQHFSFWEKNVIDWASWSGRHAALTAACWKSLVSMDDRMSCLHRRCRFPAHSPSLLTSQSRMTGLVPTGIVPASRCGLYYAIFLFASWPWPWSDRHWAGYHMLRVSARTKRHHPGLHRRTISSWTSVGTVTPVLSQTHETWSPCWYP